MLQTDHFTKSKVGWVETQDGGGKINIDIVMKYKQWNTNVPLWLLSLAGFYID